MWYQATARFDNILSPHRARASHSDSPAHSPRRHDIQNSLILTPPGLPKPWGSKSSVSPTESPKLTTLAKGLPPWETQLTVDPFIGDGRHSGRLTLPVPNSEPSFQEEPSSEENSTSNQGMLASRLSGHSLLDETGSASPANLLSNEIADFPRRQLLESGLHHAADHTYRGLPVLGDFFDHQPANPDGVSSRMNTRETSVYQQSPQRPTQPQCGNRVIPISQSAPNEDQLSNSFEGGIATYLPERLNRTKTPPSVIGRCKSGTTIDLTQASNSKDTGNSSTVSEMRIPSLTTRDPCKAGIRRESGSKMAQRLARSSSTILETRNKDGAAPRSRPKTVKKRMSSDVKGRKEGLIAHEEGRPVSAHRERDLPALSDGRSKENFRNAGKLTPHNAETKRRRVSKTAGKGGPLKGNVPIATIESRRESDAEKKVSSPVKHSEMDDLTAEGAVSRSTLGEISGNMI